jgi:hypothetical protein
VTVTIGDTTTPSQHLADKSADLPTYFLDTSALAKRYHQEDEAGYIDRMVEEPGSRSLISHISIAELTSVLAISDTKSGFADEESHGRGVSRYLLTGKCQVEPAASTIQVRVRPRRVRRFPRQLQMPELPPMKYGGSLQRSKPTSL